jgi:NADH-quinone oxidoreductase subunit M
LNFPYLSTIIFLPVLGAVMVLLFGSRARLTRWLAAAFTFIPFVISVMLFATFDRSAGAAVVQFEEQVGWIGPLNVTYHLGVDGLSLPLFALTAFLGFMVVLISWKEHVRVREYFVWLLILEASILGVFASLNLVLFFIFWEVEVIPMYFLISVWGSGRKEYSAMKYVLYTLFGSALMLAGILSIYFTTQSTDMVELSSRGLAGVQSVMAAAPMFFLLVVAFSVKLPVVPFHTWLPDAHTDAPTAGSVMLAGVLIKMGGYGIIRTVSIFPDVARQYALLLVIVAVVSTLYGAAITLRQTDLKRLIAYSSVSHMGYVLLGVFALGQISMTGAALQMVSHGLLTGLAFAVAGLTIHNIHERDLSKLGGLVRQVPFITVAFSIAGLGSLGLPATSGFAAEFLVFTGSFASTMVAGMPVYTLLAVAGIVFAAGYILWMIQRAFYGPAQDRFNGVADADGVDKTYIAAFVILILAVGIYPALVTGTIQRGISPIVKLIGG